ncbi:hypothetical protein M378DRAFT_199063 [Amanita muscaria Koide BX008]|uniref:Uncharacterized protein n=1 Tax=Amanita muscaria (strain Koide BX008) TaxID=946122 RepID=A0A0C2WML7_AMAMK|nr:hypothetical protein M378DRAFT_199063 [Amanita muscaria Koide BX008]
MTFASTSDTDSDVPETFTLAESKKSAKRKNVDVEKAHAAQRKKSKLKNQERDKLLKEQAEKRKERKGGEDPLSVEARMKRAMREAEEEASDEEEGENKRRVDVEAEVNEQSEEWKGLSDAESDSEMEEDDENSGLASDSDEEMGEEGSSLGEDSNDDGLDDPDSLHNLKTSADRLPDHVFEAAFASHQKAHQAGLKTTETGKPKTKEKKRKNKSKDIIIGSKTIRTLSSALQTSKSGAHAQTRKMQRYIDRTLSLKGGNSTVKGWQRRPANIGVFKQSGPALNFARS